MTVRLPTLLALILLVLLFTGSALVYESLPSRIPVHFSIDGMPDSWEEKSIVSWFTLPSVALALILLFQGIVLYLRRHPDGINLPSKEKYLKLPFERKREIIESMNGLLAWIGVQMVVMFSMIQYAAYRSAIGDAVPGLILIAVLLGIVSSPLLAATMLLKTQSMIDRAAREEMG